MSFKSPEKSKESILDQIQSLNANQNNTPLGTASNTMSIMNQGGFSTPFRNSNVPSNNNNFQNYTPHRNVVPGNSPIMPSPYIGFNNMCGSQRNGNVGAPFRIPSPSNSGTIRAPLTNNPRSYSLDFPSTMNSLNRTSNNSSNFAYTPNIPVRPDATPNLGLNFPVTPNPTPHYAVNDRGSLPVSSMVTLTNPTKPISQNLSSPAQIIPAPPPRRSSKDLGSSSVKRAVKPKLTRTDKVITGEDLIDLSISPTKEESNDGEKNVNSVLFEFDPLVTRERENVTTVATNDDCSANNSTVVELSHDVQEMLKLKTGRLPEAEDEVSYYEQVDPFEYMRSDSSSRSNNIYDIYDGLRRPSDGVAGDTFDIPPPLPPRSGDLSPDVVLRRTGTRASQCKRSQHIREGQLTHGPIMLTKKDRLIADEESFDFWEAIKLLRRNYSHTDEIGNPGLLTSPCVDKILHPNLSVKLKIYHHSVVDPIVFTSNLSSSVEHVVLQALASFELDCETDPSEYLLKVRGEDEYLGSSTHLGQSVYALDCVKFDRDVRFTLVAQSDVERPYLRKAEDDLRVENHSVEDLLSSGMSDVLLYDRLRIAIDLFDQERLSLLKSGYLLLDGTPLGELPSTVRSKKLVQVVKQICAIACDIITIGIVDAVEMLIATCQDIQRSQGILDYEGTDQSDHGRMVTTSSDSDSTLLKSKLHDSTSNLSGALGQFLRMYASAFRVDFVVPPSIDKNKENRICKEVRDPTIIKIMSLHRLDPTWGFSEYFIEVQLYHGSRCVGTPQCTPKAPHRVCLGSHNVVSWKHNLDMAARINMLPFEGRFVFTLFGLRPVTSSDSDSHSYVREELGWAAVQCYSHKKLLRQGPHMLSLWPVQCTKMLGSTPLASDHPQADSCALLCIDLPSYPCEVEFPPVVTSPPRVLDLKDLDINTQQQLQDIVERDIFTFNRSSAEEREILWEKRQYLVKEPQAVAKVMLSAHSWDISCLPDLHGLITNWAPPTSPQDALHLLLPIFGDSTLRKQAVKWISDLSSDDILTYLPQLVQAVKHEAWHDSPLVRLLIARALASPRLAHHLYWLLNQCLPQQTNVSGNDTGDQVEARYRRRLELISRGLMILCGNELEKKLLSQEALLRSLYETAMRIKDTKDSQRLFTLHRELQVIDGMVSACPTSLPLSPSLCVAGVETRACSYYNSFTTPLRLAFNSQEAHDHLIHAIFKVGDDLRQDMLVIQMIRLMDSLWLKAGLDLKMVTFNVIPTGDKIGIIELVREAETLRKIQAEYGVTGVFKDRPIAEWLGKMNPSALEYQRSVENFTASCAGYSVATYILGIGDRHNDNIMLKTTGHLFHIDFGKFLGDAQKFGNIKRDRTPFVLTADMAYVINGGDKSSHDFHNFVDCCCRAFNIIRANGHLLLYLFALMASSGVSGVSWASVMYVQKNLLQDLSDQEACASFARMIQDSLKSWSTQVNFFIHNLAQLRFNNEVCLLCIVSPRLIYYVVYSFEL